MNDKFGRNGRDREDEYRRDSRENNWRDPDRERVLQSPDQQFETSGNYRQPPSDTWRDRDGRYGTTNGDNVQRGRRPGYADAAYGSSNPDPANRSYDRGRFDGVYAPSYASPPSADRLAREYRGGYSGRGPKGYTRTDERIREDVCERLSWNDEVDATEISVLVEKAEVTLEGSVETRHMKRLAADIAEDVPGVADVHNTIRVRKGMLTEIKDSLTGENDDKHYANTGTKTTSAVPNGGVVRNGTS